MKRIVKISVIIAAVLLLVAVRFYSPSSQSSNQAQAAAPTAEPSAQVTSPSPSPEPSIQPTPEPESDKIIYLSFDDGPCQYTEDVLALLDKYDAKATFFVIAGRTEYMELLPEIYNAGHCLAIHAYSHDYGRLYTNANSYLEDLEKAQQVIYDYTGSYASIVRFPGGSVTANAMLREDFPVVEQALSDMGISYFDWNVQPEENKNCSGEETYIRFKTNVPSFDTPVVLQHDTRYYSVKMLEKMLQWGTENGYVFKALTTDVPEVHSRLT